MGKNIQMNLQEIMVIIDKQDKTYEIASIEEDIEITKIKITYNNGGSYRYLKENVCILQNPKEIDLDGCVVYINEMPIYKAEYILDFGEWVRIMREEGLKTQSVLKKDVSVVRSSVKEGRALHNLNYFKEIASFLHIEKGEESFLQKELKGISFVHPDSVLSSYLNRQKVKTFKREYNTVFPFEFNLSQRRAAENAFTHSVSMIEGPPGTGKTQTILNILANIAVIQNKAVAVVSNNNEAVNNVRDKLKSKGYGFLTASLGKKENQEAFFADMPEISINGWECQETVEELNNQIRNINNEINVLLRKERERFRLAQELRAWKLELEHFRKHYDSQNVEEISKLPLINENTDIILAFLADTSAAFGDKSQYKLIYRYEFVHRLKLLFKYRIFDYKKLKENEAGLLLMLQKEYYSRKIDELQEKISTLENELKENWFKDKLKKYRELSNQLFRKSIYKSHNDLQENTFSKMNYKRRFDEFIKRYPIILSTTYSLRHSIPENYLLDYVIIDEASQVDLITGVLAFSCCKNVIIVGDEKQLPQIVNKNIKEKLTIEPADTIYNYFSHNILSSVKELYGACLPCVTLREHYRCHPHIIGFCNQRYYSGDLIAYSETNLSDRPLIIYKTASGNHMRKVTRGNSTGRYNQREIDVVEEIMDDLGDDLCEKGREEIGFVTPYRKQADKASEILGEGIECDTVHKYQGREKNVMIMSTVLDSTRDGQTGIKFVDDPHMVNVAVSRAIKQFILVTDKDLFSSKGKEINSLIRYMQYSTVDENIVESKIVSVFDLLYKEYSDRLLDLKKRMDKNVKYQSEEAMRVLIIEILKNQEFEQFGFAKQVLLRNLINDVQLLNEEEIRFIFNRASLDFVIFRKMDKSCVLVIEVDGFAFHENNPEQQRRDVLKDNILKKYGIPILRLPTNGSREKEKIEAELHRVDGLE